MKGGGLIAVGPGGSIYIRRGGGWVGTYNLREGIFGRGGRGYIRRVAYIWRGVGAEGYNRRGGVAYNQNIIRWGLLYNLR